ncbi:MAG TPA: O-antigen ligase family protein [Pyrinomonadaceae bacterium]|nr:O-antigen ligase family protein [Pyrinomonadaceae bacterium]
MAPARRRHTIASRLVFLTLCVGMVLTTLFYGTVHYWALAAFSLSAVGIVCLWTLDGLVLRSTRLSLNGLQWPILGMIILGLIQLLPLRAADNAGLPLSPARTLSLDPYATRLVIVQMASLFVYFTATLIFTDTPRRLRTLVRTITIFGFLLAMFGLTQSLTTDGTRVYWFRQLTQSTAFGPFINRHHFAGYMELAIAIPLGLLFTGAIEKQKRVVYAFVATLMGVALLMTNSRGGVISLGAEIIFLAVVGTTARNRSSQRLPRGERARAAMVRAGMAFALIVVLIGGALAFGGSDIFTRLLGTPAASDPTTGRAHFWSVALDVIKAYPITGSGLGSFGVIYTRYDSRNGLFRLEQAHNDYLQTLSDGGIIGAALGLWFILILFRRGLARRETRDHFRRGVITGALAGCFAVLVHSFFDFTLHTTANALLFLILAALATQDSRVDQTTQRRSSHRRDSNPQSPEVEGGAPPPPALAGAKSG